MSVTATQAIKSLKGGSAIGIPTMNALVKAGNKRSWHGTKKTIGTWTLQKNASNSFSLKM